LKFFIYKEISIGTAKPDSLEMDGIKHHFIDHLSINEDYNAGAFERDVIDFYCKKNNITYSDSQFENEYLDWAPSLQHFINQKPDGIVLLSIFSLPDDENMRTNILNLALQNNVELHFANEYLSLKTHDDMKLIQDYLNFSPE
jgi:sporadic carbohydrate cluster protein (TIGR04323 family)